MNWGKIIGLVLATVFILLNYQIIQNAYQNGIPQVHSLMSSTSNLNFSIISFNQSNIDIKVKNPLNVSIIICNITGEYIYLNKIVIIPPNSSKELILFITNFSSLVNNINNKNETIFITVNILNTTITEVTSI